MTTTPAQPTQPQDDMTAWRGVAAEDKDDLDQRATLFLRTRSRRLLGQLLRPHRRLIRTLLLIALIENVSRLSVPYLVHLGIDRGIPPIVNGGSSRTLLLVAAAVLAMALTQASARWAFLLRSGKLGQAILLELRRRVFDHVQRLSPAFHEKYTSGRVISRLTSDVDAINEMLQTGFDGLVTALLTLIGTAVLLLSLNVKLGLIALTSFPVLLTITAWFRRQSSIIYRRTREAVALVIVHFVESMTGIRAVQAFRREPRNEEIFDGVNGRYREAIMQSFQLNAIFMPSIRLVGNVTIVGVLLYGGHEAYQGHVTVGVLAAFLLYLRQFFEPLQDISAFYNSFQSASAALEKLSGVLEEKPDLPEPAQPASMAPTGGRITFEHTSFSYVKGVSIISDLELDVPAGQTLALVGSTGAGKSTIARLAARFYDPSGGRVLLDGMDLRDLAEDDLRERVVMVTQENFLFTGTVADNIRFGRPSATMAEIVRAAKVIGAHEFITAFPGEYETAVEKRGSRLSAGQRQLVAFARAFLANPAVLILDEATSSLDIPSEQLVQAALRTILANRTALVIAHRLSTVEIADRVIVLEHGRVIEDGPPDVLIDARGHYASLRSAWVDSLA